MLYIGGRHDAALNTFVNIMIESKRIHAAYIVLNESKGGETGGVGLMDKRITKRTTTFFH